MESLQDSLIGQEFKPLPYMLGVTNLLLHDITLPNITYGDSLDRKRLLEYEDEDCVDCIVMNPPYGGIATEADKAAFPADLRSSETADLFMSYIITRLRINGRAAVVLPNGFLEGEDNARIAIKKLLFRQCNLHTVIRLPESVFSPYTSIDTNILFFDKTGSTQETWFYRFDKPEGYKHFSKTRPLLPQHFQPVDEWWDNRVEIADPDVEGAWKAKKYTVDELVAGNYRLDKCGYPHEEEESPAAQPADRQIPNRQAAHRNSDRRSTCPNHECHQQRYGEKRMSESKVAPIAAKLRASVLQQAVEGGLVPQDPDDEPSSVLLERIREERAELVKQKKAKASRGGESRIYRGADGSWYEQRGKAEPVCIDKEIPFDVPDNWTWARLDSLVSHT